MALPLTDPRLPNEDPRQTVYALLKSMGLSVLLAAPAPIEHVLDEAVRRAPLLARSSRLGRGLMRLDADPETAWAAVESPRGSAVIVFGSPRSDSDLLSREIVFPFEQGGAPFAREMVFAGEADAPVVALLEDFDVVAVTEFAPFDATNAEHHVLPITAHRAAAGWTRLTKDLYTRTFEDADHAQVFLTLMNGRVELLTPVGEGEPPAWTAPMVAAGTYRIEFLDPAVALAVAAPQFADSHHLEAVARRFVADAAAAFEAAQRAARAPVPETPSRRSLHERVAHPVPGRPWNVPGTVPETSVIERVRESVAGESTFASVDAAARALRQRRGSGFEHVWRGADDALLSPSWLTVRSVAVHHPTGFVAAGGHLTHERWGMDPAHDLGAIDGRNGVTFSEAGHQGGLVWPSDCLYVGSLRAGTLLPLDATVNVMSVDIDPSGERIAVLHHYGGDAGGVTLVSHTGERQLLTVLEGLSGAETIRFSGDGTWLLVWRSRDSVLVDVATGRHLALPVANADWWPTEPSVLLSIHHEDGRAYPRLFDLASNEYAQSFPAIELDVPLLEEFPYVWHPTVSPDGSEVLGVSVAGVDAEYQRTHGAGSHLVRFVLATGRGRVIHGVFLDDAHELERDASEPRWGGRAPAGPTAMHPHLRALLQEPVTVHDWAQPGRWGDEAEPVLVRTLNLAIERTRAGEDVDDLMPEILAYLVPVAADAGVWARQSEWLLGLRDTTVSLVAAGTLQGALAASWRRYGSAIGAIEAGRLDLVDPLGNE
jgi:hypothetical protein